MLQYNSALSPSWTVLFSVFPAASGTGKKNGKKDERSLISFECKAC